MLQFDIERLVPRFLLEDRNGYAMSKAVEAGLKYACEKISEGIDLIGKTDTMPGWRCDEYAWEMGAVWYDSTASVAEKRAQVKAIPSIYSTIGTKNGVVNAVVSLFNSSGYIREWFDYSGQPYHYKVFVTNESVLQQRNAECLRLLNIVSGARTVLDSVQYVGAKGTTGPAHAATAYGGSYGWSSGTAT